MHFAVSSGIDVIVFDSESYEDLAITDNELLKLLSNIIKNSVDVISNVSKPMIKFKSYNSHNGIIIKIVNNGPEIPGRMNLRVDFISKLILSAVSLYCIWHQAPVISPEMQLTRPELINRNRILGISISAVLLVICVISYNNTMFSNTILWTMTFQALLMFNKRNVHV